MVCRPCILAEVVQQVALKWSGIWPKFGPAGGVCQMWYVHQGQGYVPWYVLELIPQALMVGHTLLMPNGDGYLLSPQKILLFLALYRTSSVSFTCIRLR